MTSASSGLYLRLPVNTRTRSILLTSGYLAFTTAFPAAAQQAMSPKGEASTAPVASDSMDPETRVLAREFAIRGAEAFEAGNYEAALEHFNRAAALLDAPSLTIMQGRTLAKLGRWLEGLDKLQQTARLVLDSDAPQPYKDAVAEAGREAEALRRQIPQLTILLDQKRQASPRYQVEFDGKPVPDALLNVGRPVNPGQHLIRGLESGRVFFEHRVELDASQQVEVEIPPAPVQAEPIVAPLRPVAPTLPTEPDPQGTSSPWPFYAALGLASAGVVGVGLTTVLGNNYKATLDRKCDVKTSICPAEYSDEIEALDATRTFFYVSAGLVVLGGGLATYVWLTDESQSQQLAVRLAPDAISLVGRY